MHDVMRKFADGSLTSRVRRSETCRAGQEGQPMEPGTLSPLPQTRQLARQLETSFAAELLRAARPQQKASGFAGRGTGGDAFDSFMDEALGAAMVARGGLGLAPALEKAIAGRSQGVPR